MSRYHRASHHEPPALIVSQEPLSLFWKDRGGKRNQLRCLVESPLPVSHVRG
jgi:hypothetical protein